MKTPDHTEYVESAGGEVRYYCDGRKWRYVCSGGEGGGFDSLEAAQAEVGEFASAPACGHTKGMGIV